MASDFETGIAVGMLINNKKSEPTPVVDDWTPPDHWLKVPEPATYEIYFLVDIVETSNKYLQLYLADPETAKTGIGKIICDWGDGTIEQFDNGKWSSYLWHDYENSGQYVAKITTTATSCFLQKIRPNAQHGASSNILIAKLGSKIIINNDEYSGGAVHEQEGFRYQEKLHYIKLSGNGGLTREYCFNSCRSLRKIDITIPLVTIPKYTFSGCFNLKKFDFSEVTEIEAYGLSGTGFEKLDIPKCETISLNAIVNNTALNNINMPSCTSIETNGIYGNQGIKKLSLPACTSVAERGINNNIYLENVVLPECTSIGDYGLANNYSLKTVNVADGCIFGTNCFSGNYVFIASQPGI